MVKVDKIVKLITKLFILLKAHQKNLEKLVTNVTISISIHLKSHVVYKISTSLKTVFLLAEGKTLTNPGTLDYQ